MSIKKSHTFVSYTIRDGLVNRELLTKIKTFYERFGSVFVDLLDNNSLNKQDRIFQEIEKADLLVLIKTPSIYKSPWVNLEIEKASLKKIPIEHLDIKQIKKITATNNLV